MYSAASFLGLAGTIVMMVLVGVIFLTGRRSPARASRDAAHALPDRNPAATVGDGVHRGVSAARFAGVAGAIAMIALIGAISLTGRWPSGEIILPAPEVRGILAVPADQVAHVQVSVGAKDLVFRHRSEGGWLVNGLMSNGARAGLTAFCAGLARQVAKIQCDDQRPASRPLPDRPSALRD